MRFLLLIAAVAAALSLAASATASLKDNVTHNQRVIRFFDHHRSLARTPAGQRALWAAIHHLTNDAAQLSRQLDAVAVTWPQAVAAVRRYISPSIAAWELSCSSTEGGWGGFEWYSNLPYPKYGPATTPGGNMQFMQSTFDGVIDGAVSYAKARGVPLNDSARSFYSPLGQALAGVEMYRQGRTGAWTGSGC